MPKGRPPAPRTTKQNIGVMTFALGGGAFGVVWLVLNPEWSNITSRGLPVWVVGFLLIGTSLVLFVAGLRGFLNRKS